MTDLIPSPELTPVPQLEVNTLALGGTGNPMNMQAQALLNRDGYRATQISALAQDIADIQSELGGFSASEVQWMFRTVGARLGDVSNPKDHGAIADGNSHPLSERYATLAEAQADYPFATNLTDEIDWAACQSSLNENKLRWEIPDGHYVINRNLTRSTSINIDQVGVLDFSSGTGSLRIVGQLTQIQDLSANVTKSTRTFTFASAPELSPLDVFILYNPTDYSWAPFRDYYRAGEFFRAHSISGTSVTIYGLPSDPYLAADMDVYRMDTLEVVWTGPNLIAPAASPLVAAAFISLATKVSIKDPRSRGGVYAGISIDRSYDLYIPGGSVKNNSTPDGDDYAIVLSNCQKFRIIGAANQASRHAVALGGGSAIGCVPYRDGVIEGCTLETSGALIGASDMHGNGDNIRYVNCYINSHANISGRDPSYIGCKILGRTNADGCAVFGAEIVGGDYKFIDCEMVTEGNLNDFGLINLTCTDLLRYDLNVIVRNLRVRGGGGGTLAKLLKVSPFTGETKKINTDVRGLRNELSKTLCVTWVRNEFSTGSLVVSDGHIVDDVYGPSGMYLLYPNTAAIAGVPSREMMQSGSATVTTSASTSAQALAQNYRYPFSKVPTSFSASIAGVGGANLDTVGGQNATARIKLMTNTQITPAIQANAAFTEGATASVGWFAGIREI